MLSPSNQFQPSPGVCGNVGCRGRDTRQRPQHSTKHQMQQEQRGCRETAGAEHAWRPLRRAITALLRPSADCPRPASPEIPARLLAMTESPSPTHRAPLPCDCSESGCPCALSSCHPPPVAPHLRSPAAHGEALWPRGKRARGRRIRASKRGGGEGAKGAHRPWRGTRSSAWPTIRACLCASTTSCPDQKKLRGVLGLGQANLQCRPVPRRRCRS